MSLFRDRSIYTLLPLCVLTQTVSHNACFVFLWHFIYVLSGLGMSYMYLTPWVQEKSYFISPYRAVTPTKIYLPSYETQDILVQVSGSHHVIVQVDSYKLQIETSRRLLSITPH